MADRPGQALKEGLNARAQKGLKGGVSRTNNPKEKKKTTVFITTKKTTN
jgi:hypothetical protein